MSENDETKTPEQKEEPCSPETNTDKDITFTSIAETLKNKENKVLLCQRNLNTEL